jgi:hypothetical protein
MLLEQGPALSFGHPAPDSELDAVVQGVCSALQHHRTMPTDHRGLTLGGSTDKQFIGVGRTT